MTSLVSDRGDEIRTFDSRVSRAALLSGTGGGGSPGSTGPGPSLGSVSCGTGLGLSRTGPTTAVVCCRGGARSGASQGSRMQRRRALWAGRIVGEGEVPYLHELPVGDGG